MESRLLILSPSGRSPIDLGEEDSLARNAADALKQLNKRQYELLVICPGELSISREVLIRRALIKDPLIGVIVIGKDTIKSRIAETLVDIFLPEDSTDEHIAGQIEQVLKTRRILNDCDLVGKSPELKAIGELIFRVAPTDLPVLIVGESGTGKELVARAIHKHSARKNKPFLPVNAAAIPDGTLESELFGHEKGSFTGAAERHRGYFEQADHGTIFLDEVAELPLPVQAKLLRVLETGDFIRVGGSGTVHVDIRLIAATKTDITETTINKEFREDLYYRLAAVRLKIPPLRERPEDIPILVYKFMSEISDTHERRFGGISEAAINRMLEYHWPGNIRELRNLVENAVLLAGERQVKPSDLEGYFSDHEQMGRVLPAAIDGKTYLEKERIGAALALIYSELKSLEKKMDDLGERLDRPSVVDPAHIEKNRILKALRDNDFDKKAAAKDLGISIRTLYRRLNKYDIEI